MVDCLRGDYVTPEKMPWLSILAKRQINFSNYWSVSHCTDPSVTAMITGKHPDDLGLYSMMFEQRAYSIPEETETILQTAQKAGYKTVSITGQWRWYFWGADVCVDTRGLPRRDDFDAAIKMMDEIERPWFVFMHNTDMHSDYANGSYDAAAKFVDENLRRTVAAARKAGAVTVIVSDHGEGLGQAGPDGVKVPMHGWSMWDFLTHVPLILDVSQLGWEVGQVDSLVCNLDIHKFLTDLVGGAPSLDAFEGRDAVFQAGGTPRMFTRGVVYPNQKQYVQAYPKDVEMLEYWIGRFGSRQKERAIADLADHLGQFEMTNGEEQAVLERLVGLGYFE